VFVTLLQAAIYATQFVENEVANLLRKGQLELQVRDNLYYLEL